MKDFYHIYRSRDFEIRRWLQECGRPALNWKFLFWLFSSFSWKLNPSGFFELDEWFEPVRTAVNSGSVYTTRWRRAVDLKEKIFLGMKIKNLKLRIKFWVWMSLIHLVWTFDVDLVKTPKIRSGLRFPLLSRSFLPAWTGRDRLIGKRS